MFTEDFQRTYNRVETRSKELAAEMEADEEVEQIQLVAEDPNVEIGFRLPDGPPPEELRVEGEGADQIDIEDVSDPPCMPLTTWKAVVSDREILIMLASKMASATMGDIRGVSGKAQNCPPDKEAGRGQQGACKDEGGRRRAGGRAAPGGWHAFIQVSRRP